MTSSLSKRAINRQRWFDHIQAWKQSDLTQKAFCENHHLVLASFQRWHQKFRAIDKPAESSSVSFLPVSVMDTRHSHFSNLTVRFNDNFSIEICAGFDPNTLQQVIQILKAS